MEEGIELRDQWLADMVEKYNVTWGISIAYPVDTNQFTTTAELKLILSRQVGLAQTNYTEQTITIHPVMFHHAETAIFKDCVLHEIAHYLMAGKTHKHTVRWYRTYLQLCKEEGIRPLCFANGTVSVKVEEDMVMLK